TKTGSEAADLRAVAASPPDEAAAERLSRRSPYYNALLHTTCVPTRLAAGHADNALPRSATATVNCRVFPGVSADDVEVRLREVVADTGVHFARVNTPTPSPPSPLTPEVMEPIRRLVDEMFDRAPIIPSMSTGATDGLATRNGGIPTYGVSALFGDPEDARAHGKDERVLVRSYYEALDFWYRMVKAFGGP
ncbi:MAG: M20/M25/M40 family metallo-hydrolase, partial [Gemmatimonadetes bacterium]